MVGTLAMVACRQPASIQPASIVFSKAFTGVPVSTDLHFTVGGRPLASASYSLTGEDAGIEGLRILPPQPLDTAYQLQLDANQPGLLNETLTVNASDAVYVVPVTAHVAPAPDCSSLAAANDPCHVVQPDPTSGRCTVQTIPDGSPCEGDCMGQTCHAGACFPEAPVMCPIASPAVALEPSWSTPWPSGSNPPAFDVFDQSGTQYLVPLQSDTLEIVYPLGRTRQVSLGQRVASRTAAMVLGSLLVLESRDLSPPIQARHLSDGSLAWSSTAVKPDALVAMTAVNGGSQIVVAGDRVATLDAATGSVVAQADLPGSGLLMGLASDGARQVWAVTQSTSPPIIGSLSSIDPASGLATTAAETTESAKPGAFENIATNGTVVVSGLGAWQSSQIVTGFPPPETPLSLGTVIRSDGVVFALSSLHFGCSPMFFDAFNATLQPLSHCGLPGIGASALSVTADGKLAVLIQDAISQFRLIILSSDGTAAAAFALNGIGNLEAAALVGGKLFVTTDSAFAAFDLPGITAATHGWISHGGNPQQTFAPL